MLTAVEIAGETAVVAKIVESFKVTEAPINILIGPPGTGKTNSAAQIISQLDDHFAATIWRGNALTATMPEAVLASNLACTRFG